MARVVRHWAIMPTQTWSRSSTTRPAQVVLALLIAGMIATIWIGVNLPVDAATRPAPPPHWVRTKDGWERSEWLFRAEPVQANLHPLILAAFIAMASSLGLLAFAREAPPTESPVSGAAH